MSKFKNRIDRTAKSITKESERSQKLRRQLQKRETWIQCQCPHGKDMLHLIPSSDPTNRLYQCRCGKKVSLNMTPPEDVEKSFAVVDKIIDNMKTAARPDQDEKILDHLATLQYNLIGLHQTYLDWTSRSKQQNADRRRNQDRDGGVNININPRTRNFYD